MTRSTARRIALCCILLSTCTLAYFCLLDYRILGVTLFPTRSFAPIFDLLLALYDPGAAWLALIVVVVAIAWTRPDPVLRLVDALAARPLAVAASCTLALALGALFVYHDYPFSMDEYAAAFQAKVFASGHLYARLPPAVLDWLVLPGFNGAFLIASGTTGHVIEGYWPGFALLLAPFELVHAPWLCNPVLAGIAVYLVSRIALELTGEPRAAGWAMLFALASSAFDAYAISYYSMQAHLTLNLLYAWLLLRPSRQRAFAAGLVGGLALVLHNPFPHTLFAMPWIVAIAADRDRRRHLLPLLLGYLPVAAAVGLGWLSLRNEILAAAHAVAADRRIVSGVFGWPDALVADMRTASLAKMLLWAVPGLFPLAALGWYRARRIPGATLLALSAAATFLGYLFVRLDQGHGWGYRYFHSAWGAIPVLAACAMTGDGEGARRLGAFAGAAAVLSLLVLVPFQMRQIDGIIGRHLAQLPRPHRPGNNVYFLDYRFGFYVSDMIQIDPLLRDRDLYLATRGPALDRQLIRENWPGARRVDGNLWSEQWYLGPVDRRVTTDPAVGPHFVLRFTPEGSAR